jgi:hypothetical protein
MRREPATVWDSRGVAIIGWRSGDGGMKRGVGLEGTLPPGASATGEALVAVREAPARAPAVRDERSRHRVEHFRHIAGHRHRGDHLPQRFQMQAGIVRQPNRRPLTRVKPVLTVWRSSHGRNAARGRSGGSESLLAAGRARLPGLQEAGVTNREQDRRRGSKAEWSEGDYRS